MSTSKHKWGRSKLLLCDGATQVEYLHGWKGGASSCHRHHHKSSYFWVLSGRMSIHAGPLGHEEVLADLTPMESCEIPSGWWHRILFLEHSTAIEVYRINEGVFVSPIATLLSDIERSDIGVEPEHIPTSEGNGRP